MTINLVCSFCMSSILLFMRALLFYCFDVSAHILRFSLNFVTIQNILGTSLSHPSPEQAPPSTFTVLLKIYIFKLNRSHYAYTSLFKVPQRPCTDRWRVCCPISSGKKMDVLSVPPLMGA